MLIPIILLATSLSIDALGVGVVYGLRKIKIPFVSKLIICLFSIFYSGLALELGRFFSNTLSISAAKIIGALILIFMGIWIVLQGLINPNQSNGQFPQNVPPKSQLLKIAIKSLGITIQVIRDPVRYDADQSGSIDLIESVFLGLGLSVDAIGAGIGSALMGLYSLLIPLIIGLFQLFFLYIGSFCGNRFGVTLKLKERWVSVLPGLILIIMAVIRI